MDLPLFKCKVEDDTFALFSSLCPLAPSWPKDVGVSIYYVPGHLHYVI